MAKAKTKEISEEDKEPKLTSAKGGDAEAKEGEGEGEEGEEGHAKGKKSKKKLIIIAAAVIVLLAGAGGAYFMGLFGKHEEKAAADVGKDGKPVEKQVFYTLPEFIVNLNSSGKQSSFLKASIILDLAQQGDVAQVEANLPRLLDAFNTYLRELRPSDLAGSAGIQRLREELLVRANKTLAPVKINDVLFKEIIVQ